MLVLTRKPGETIIIGDNIQLTVVSIGAGRVKLGVVAPPTVRVDRQEVRESKLAEQGEAMPSPVIVDAAPAFHNRIASQLTAEDRASAGERRLRGIRRPPFPPRKPR